MLSSFLIAIAGIVTIACFWLAVQRLWQRHFPEQGAVGETDALAGRGGCHGCNCAPSHCERDLPPPQPLPKEGR